MYQQQQVEAVGSLLMPIVHAIHCVGHTIRIFFATFVRVYMVSKQKRDEGLALWKGIR